MLGYTWTLITAQSDGAALASSTAATSLLPTQAKYTLPANFLAIGSKLRFHVSGRISTVITTPGTLTLDIRFGSVIVATSPAFALNVAAQTNDTWILDWHLTCRAIGGSTSANFMHAGMWTTAAVIGGVAAATGGTGSLLIPATAPAVGTGFDSTAAQQIDFFGTWSVSNAANSIQVHQFAIDSLN
jgi:hypothetical protein